MTISATSSPAPPPIQVRHAARIAAMQVRHKDMMRTASLAAVVTFKRPAPIPTPRQCKAKGPPNDDTVALQRWVDLQGPLQCWERHQHNGYVGLSGNTTIDCHGLGAFYGPNNSLVKWYNKNAVFTGTDRIDKDITLKGMTFEGDPNGAVTAIENVCFIGVENLTFIDCVFKHSRTYFCTLSNNKNVKFIRCRFEDWGDNRPYATPGDGQFWTGPAVMEVTPNDGLTLEDCTFVGGHWIALWVNSLSTYVNARGLIFDGFGENAIVGLPPGYIQVTSISNGFNVDVSGGNFIEAWGNGWTMAIGKFAKSQGRIWLTDAQDVTFQGGSVEVGPSGWSAQGAITIRNYAPSSPTRDISILGTRLRAPKGGIAQAVSFLQQNSAKNLMDGLNINVDTGDPAQWGIGPFGYYSPGNEGLDKSLVLSPRSAGKMAA